MGWWPYLENNPPTCNGIFGVQKYFLFIVQHNIIEFQKHKRIGCPDEITVIVVIKFIIICFDGKRKEGRVSVSTLTYLQNRNKSQK